LRHTKLINYALYQIGWFACVLGGASQRRGPDERPLEVRLAVLTTAVGAVVEMMISVSGFTIVRRRRDSTKRDNATSGMRIASSARRGFTGLSRYQRRLLPEK
jgi:hypothetical protein